MFNITPSLRKFLFAAGLAAITLSIGLAPYFARDDVAPVPEPGTLPLLALGGVVAMALALARRRKK